MSNPDPLQTPEALSTAFDVERVRADFPILSRTVHGKPLVYLDNGASAQKPEAVIEAEMRCYREYYANIHRGVHALSQQSTKEYEGARSRVAEFINAPRASEVVFTRGTTESINLVAHSFVRPRLKAGDQILITGMEHHSNIVPWQMLSEETGATLKVVPLSEAGDISVEEFRSLITPRTKFVSVCHVSNALGTINPVKDIIRIAHERDIPVLVDGAQAIPHMSVDVTDLDCDFYAFSAHKLYGPTGVGVLYGKASWLKGMRPYQGGGDMIRYVTFEKTEFADPPQRFEAGTPEYCRRYRSGRGHRLRPGPGPGAHRRLRGGSAGLCHGPHCRDRGGTHHRHIHPQGGGGVLRDGSAHPHDIGTMLDGEGIAIRAGHHCAQPVMQRYGIPATARASFGLYNTRGEVDELVAASTRLRRCLVDVRSARSVPGGHPGPQQAAAESAWSIRRAITPMDTIRCAATVSDLAERARRGGRRYQLPGRGLRHLDGLGFHHDRSAEGQDAGGGEAHFRGVPRARDHGRCGAVKKLGKLEVLGGMREYPTRVKCATLVWHTLHAALDEKGEAVSTE